VNINTNDEIEHLGRNFNMMASSLAQNRDRLEDRVSKATNELAKANQDLLKLDTLKSDFLTNMSHELRTPLTAAKGGIDYLARTLKEKNDLKYIKIVDKNLSRLTWLINDLFDFTKLEAGKIDWEFEKEDISQLVKEVIEILSPIAIKKDVSIKFSNPGSISAVIDLERIEQVLVNILDNAIKFSENNTKIEISLLKEQDSIVISIKNYGPGISEKHLENIFEKFYTGEKRLKQKKKGTGLGLAISKAIIKAHKGQIKAESSPDGPTVFYVILPLEIKHGDKS
jgi:signal transduction histidine kinase